MLPCIPTSSGRTSSSLEHVITWVHSSSTCLCLSLLWHWLHQLHCLLCCNSNKSWQVDAVDLEMKLIHSIALSCIHRSDTCWSFWLTLSLYQLSLTPLLITWALKRNQNAIQAISSNTSSSSTYQHSSSQCLVYNLSTRSSLSLVIQTLAI